MWGTDDLGPEGKPYCLAFSQQSHARRLPEETAVPEHSIFGEGLSTFSYGDDSG